MPGATRVGSRLRYDNPNRDRTREKREKFHIDVYRALYNFRESNPDMPKEDILPIVSRLCFPIAIEAQKEHDDFRARPETHTLESLGHGDAWCAEYRAEDAAEDKHHSKNTRLANVNFQRVIDMKRDDGEDIGDFWRRQLKVFESALTKLFNINSNVEYKIYTKLKGYKAS